MPCRLPPELFSAAAPMLEAHEGKRRLPYTDTAGKVSIGIGRNLTDCGLSEAEIYYLFNNDLDSALATCKRLLPACWDALTTGRKAALIDMAFNLGYARMSQFTLTLAALREARYSDAARQMRDSIWAQQLPHRVADLARMVEQG